MVLYTSAIALNKLPASIKGVRFGEFKIVKFQFKSNIKFFVNIYM